MGAATFNATSGTPKPPTQAAPVGLAWLTVTSAAVAGTLGAWAAVASSIGAPLDSLVFGGHNTGVDKVTFVIGIGAGGFQVETGIRLFAGIGDPFFYTVPFFLPTSTNIWAACSNLDNVNVNQLRLWTLPLLR